MKTSIPIPTEHEEALTLCSWLRAHNIAFHHIANEGGTSAIRGARLKREGLSKGFPDYCIFIRPGVILFIELKRTKGSRASEEQKGWIKFLKDQCHYATIAAGADEAIRYIQWVQKDCERLRTCY